MDLYLLIGRIFRREAAARLLCRRFEEAYDRLLGQAARLPRRDVLYLIWKDPWMTVSRDTYVSRLLALANWHTVGDDPAVRYPQFEITEAALADVDVVLFSTEPFAFDESHVEAFRRDHPEARSGVAMIDESFGDRDIGALHDAGVRGARFNFVAHLGGAPDLPSFHRMVLRVAAFGWHIVLHFDAVDLPRYAGLLDALPVPYIIDHMARVDAAAGLDQEPFQRLLALLTDERCWVKISGAERLTAGGPPPYDDVVPFAQALIRAAPDRVLWGTDWPHPNVRAMPDDGDLVDVLALYAPDPETRDRILVENPERLYDFA